jgi:hypothetical protein
MQHMEYRLLPTRNVKYVHFLELKNVQLWLCFVVFYFDYYCNCASCSYYGYFMLEDSLVSP